MKRKLKKKTASKKTNKCQSKVITNKLVKELNDAGNSLEATFKLVAIKTSVKSEAIKSRWYSKNKSKDRNHGNIKLSIDEEDMLVGTILAFDGRDTPLSSRIS
jgi:hypothetical protein